MDRSDNRKELRLLLAMLPHFPPREITWQFRVNFLQFKKKVWDIVPRRERIDHDTAFVATQNATSFVNRVKVNCRRIVMVRCSMPWLDRDGVVFRRYFVASVGRDKVANHVDDARES